MGRESQVQCLLKSDGSGQSMQLLGRPTRVAGTLLRWRSPTRLNPTVGRHVPLYTRGSRIIIAAEGEPMLTNKSSNLIAFMALLALLLSGCKTASINTTAMAGVLDGTVSFLVSNPYQHTETESPIANATIELLNAAAKDANRPTVIRTTTDTQGRYAFEAVRPGTYTIRAVIWDKRPDDPGYLRCSEWMGGGARDEGSEFWVYLGEKETRFAVSTGEVVHRKILLRFSSECGRNWQP